MKIVTLPAAAVIGIRVGGLMSDDKTVSAAIALVFGVMLYPPLYAIIANTLGILVAIIVGFIFNIMGIRLR